MTLSDSDDSCDDDLLLSADPFSSRSAKRQKAQKSKKETKMLGFLDECFSTEQERSERNQRIQQALIVKKVDTKEEEEEDNKDSLNEGNQKKKKEGTKTAAPLTLTDNKKTSCNNEQEEEEVVDWEKRIKNETKLISRSAKTRRKRALNDALDGLLDMSQDDYDLEGHHQDDGDDDDDDDDECDSDSDENNGGGGGGRTLAMTEEDRRAERVARASAKVTGMSTNLGARRAFYHPASVSSGGDKRTLIQYKKDDNLRIMHEVFESPADAMSHLSRILKTMPPRHTTKKKGNGGDGFVKALSKANKTSMQLSAFLFNGSRLFFPNRNAAGLKRKRDTQWKHGERNPQQQIDVTTTTMVISSIPIEIQCWLWRMACSGNRIGAFLAEGARRTLMSAMLHHASEEQHDTIQIENSSIASKKKHETRRSSKRTSPSKTRANNSTNSDMEATTDWNMFEFNTFEIGLIQFFGLLPVPSSSLSKQHKTEEEQGDDKSTNVSSKVKLDVIGLKHFLDLWNIAIKQNVLSKSTFESSTTIDSTATTTLYANNAMKMLGVLIRVSLDPCFYSGLG